jgi:phage baseplate assembly protein gpV
MDELTEAFRKLKKRDVDTFPAVVVSVDKEQGTCTVKVDDLELTNVQLSAIIDGSNKKCYLFPKVESSVLISPINEDLHRLYVEAYSEIESFDLNIEQVRFQVDQDGFLMKKENETLKALMVDLIGAVKNMSFTVNTTGTAAAQTGATTSLVNVAEFVVVENRFKQFLKDN